MYSALDSIQFGFTITEMAHWLTLPVPKDSIDLRQVIQGLFGG